MADAEIIPLKLTTKAALRAIRELAKDSKNIVVLRHASVRAKQRKVSRIQIERCLQRGTIIEGPIKNQHGHWQVNVFRHAAGEELTCTVAIDWARNLLVITVF